MQSSPKHPRGGPSRILFVAEDITLAQVARPASLAQSVFGLPGYEVHFACGAFPDVVFRDLEFPKWPLLTVDRIRLLDRIRAGHPLYTRDELAAYVEADEQLLRRVRPDLVVGDFRLSLGISCRLRRVPYAALMNAYWHPHHTEAFPMPVHASLRWMNRYLGSGQARKHFDRALPFVLRAHARAYNRARRHHGLAPVRDLRHMLCDADYLLFPDPPELVPVGRHTRSQHFLGNVPWSPAIDPSTFERERKGDDRWVYVTMGSSGSDAMLVPVLGMLRERGLQVFLASLGRPLPDVGWPGLHVYDMLPGDAVSRGARLVICNGGASTAYQALSAGVPVLGLPANLDQLWFMQCVERASSGVAHRPDGPREGLENALIRALTDPSLHKGAARVAGWIEKHNAFTAFRRFVDELLGAL